MDNKPALSKRGLYAYVIGSAIGAGMFVTLPGAIGHTGKSVVLAVIIASIVYFFGYWYTVALSAQAPIHGAGYGYISFICPPAMSGIYGIAGLMWLMSNCVYATGAIEYLAVFFPALKPYIGIGAAVLITLFMIIDYVGVSLGAKVEEFLTIILTVCVLVFIGIGITKVDPSAFFASTGSEPFFANGFIGFSKAVALCIWVIGGIGGAALCFAKDVEKPTRTIPYCIIVVSIFIGIVGVLICYVCAGAVPVSEAVEGVNVVAEAILPRFFFPVFIIGGAVFALLSTLLAYILSYRREILAQAEDGFLPKVLTKKIKGGYPIWIGVLIWIAGIIPCLTGFTIDTIASYTGVPSYLILIYVNVKLFKLPEDYPDLWKKSIFRNWSKPLWNTVCSFAIICSLYLVYIYLADFGPIDLLYMAVAVCVMYGWAYYRMKSGKADLDKLKRQKEEIVQEALEYAKEY